MIWLAKSLTFIILVLNIVDGPVLGSAFLIRTLGRIFYTDDVRSLKNLNSAGCSLKGERGHQTLSVMPRGCFLQYLEMGLGAAELPGQASSPSIVLIFLK
jgi:hypothetical protein